MGRLAVIMIKSLINILSIALIYFGTVFGAGFASGQEISAFFSAHKSCGVLVSLLVGFLFSFFGYIICQKSKTYNLSSAGEFFDLLFSKRIASFLNFICMSFLAVCFCIMIAGCGALFTEQFSINAIAGTFLSLLICYTIIRNKTDGLAWFNTLITPFMIVGIVVLCVLCLNNTKLDFESVRASDIGKASFSGLLYLSYNIMSAAAVLVPCAKISRKPVEAGVGGALGGILITFPMVLLSKVLTEFPKTWSSQLPFFALVYSNFPYLKLFCGIILYCAMLTTAASSGVSLLAKVRDKYSGKSALILCITAFFVSYIPFDVLVKSMYSIFGVCGIILIIGIIKFIFKQKREKEYIKE